jgi:diacylglycerol kinase (ATP)
MLIITHGGAGRFDDETVERVVGVLRAGDGEQVDVRQCGTQEELERTLDERDDEIVVAAGGDGSIHQLVATLYARDELSRRTVGLLPLGTGNDLARNLGIPLDPAQAARLTPRSGRLDASFGDGDGELQPGAHPVLAYTRVRWASADVTRRDRRRVAGPTA